MEQEERAPGLPPPEISEVDQLRAELEEARRERDQFKALAQRAQADLLNYRKRVEEEREEAQRALTASVLQNLLPLLDDLERAVASFPRDRSEALSAWQEGVELVVRRFHALLEGMGVRKIEAQGKAFDPWEHEALGTEETREVPEGQVLRVVREGYKLQGRVLRPALVVVATAPRGEGPAESPPPATERRE